MEATLNKTNFFLRMVQYYNLNALGKGKGVNCCIDFNLPYDSDVKLNIFNLSGQLAMMVYNNKHLKTGFHSKRIDLNTLPPGDYYYELETNQNKEIKYLKHLGKYAK